MSLIPMSLILILRSVALGMGLLGSLLLTQSQASKVVIQPKNSGMSYLKFYLVPMTLDRQLAIAFEADTELPVGLLEQTITTVSGSLREDPTLNKKKKRRPSSSSLN